MLELLKNRKEESYRTKMNITNLHIHQNAAYPICPRCGAILERDYLKYCNECGQCLGWENYDSVN